MRKNQTTLSGVQTPSRPTIGVFMAYIDGYNCSVWAGIADVARECEVNVIAFGGRPLYAPAGFEAQNNIIYSLTNPELLDGLIILAGAIGAYIAPAEIHAFCRRYASKPLVCIGQEFPDFPCILLDNKPGLRDLMEHLIVDHGYRRIAFIHGHDNVDAQQRYEAYAEVLMRHHIPLDPELIAPGDLVLESGIKAIELLVDQRKLEIEAIVAANDYTALGAIQALEERGVNVPDDVALTGFDNIREGWYALPPLTTVEQPMYAIGRRAAEILLAQCQGADVPQQIMEPTRFIVRQSCGCLSQIVRQVEVGRTAASAPQAIVQDQHLLALAAQKGAILDEIEGIMRMEYGGVMPPVFREHCARLLEDVLAELRDDATDRFAPALARILRHLILSGRNLARWSDIISLMRRRMWPFLTTVALVERAETLWQQAQILVGEMILQAQSHQHLQAERQAQILRDIGQTLITTFDVNQLMDVIAEKLPHLGITSCYLALYEHQANACPSPESPEWTRLHLAYTEAGRIALEPEGRRFRSRRLLPEELLAFERQVCLLVIPLFFRENQLGFCLLEGNQRDYYIYDVLRGEISSALQGALLLEARKLAEEELRKHRDHLEELVKERTADLEREIVERKRAEQTVKEERNLLRTLIDTLPDHIFVKDTQARFLLVNHPSTERGTTSSDALIGKTDFDLFPRDIAEHFYADDMRIIQTGVPLLNKEETNIEPETGHIRWVMVSKVPFRDQQGNILGLVGIARDITERKRAEEELKHHRDHLEELVKERTEELEWAKDAADAANQAKSAFLAMMSHEIRTPMNGIIGMTSLLLDTSLTQQQRDFADTIRTSGETLLTIINDLLDFSKIEAGKLDLERYPFNLRECVESALDLVAAKAAEKGLDLAYMIDAHVPTTIIGDLTRLRQILLNLLSNAVKFTKQGEIVVNVTSCELRPSTSLRMTGDGVCEVTPNDQHPAFSIQYPEYDLHFSVKDTGIGIPPDRMNSLFQSFSQVDSSTARKYGGTGLGLAISKRLTEMMGGTIWVESDLGAGSIFHFTIQAQAAESAPPAYLSHEQPSLHGKRVLVVDDNETNRKILILQTQSWEMKPVAVTSGIEALERIRTGEAFDVAILDMHMPEMDGVTLAEEIRHYRDAQTLPLVMLSSLGMQETETRRDYFAAFLTKPIKASQLYNTLIEVFAGKTGPGARRDQAEVETVSEFDSQMVTRLPLRILLAEDNATNQKLALLTLKRFGYDADVAWNGVEVLDALRRQPYDVVLMDVQMPEMDGLEATRRIREEFPVDRQPQIIAVTANAMREDREQCLTAGMNKYISKPFKANELLRALKQCQPVIERKAEEQKVRRAEEQKRRPLEIPPLLASEAFQNLQATFGEDLSSVLPELIDSFLDSVPKLLDELQQAMQQGNPDEVGRKAHTLKSSSAVLGATTFSVLCREVENIAKAGTLEGATERIAQIEAEYEKVKAALKEMGSLYRGGT